MGLPSAVVEQRQLRGLFVGIPLGGAGICSNRGIGVRWRNCRGCKMVIASLGRVVLRAGASFYRVYVVFYSLRS